MAKSFGLPWRAEIGARNPTIKDVLSPIEIISLRLRNTAAGFDTLIVQIGVPI